MNDGTHNRMQTRSSVEMAPSCLHPPCFRRQCLPSCHSISAPWDSWLHSYSPRTKTSCKTCLKGIWSTPIACVWAAQCIATDKTPTVWCVPEEGRRVTQYGPSLCLPTTTPAKLLWLTIKANGSWWKQHGWEKHLSKSQRGTRGS